MNLKTGSLYWLETYPDPPQYPVLEEDIECDVLIIGAGESGSHCAYFLSETDLKTVVVEKRKAGFGSTSANTGLIQFSNDKMLSACINTFGKERGVRHYKLCEKAVKDLEEEVSKLDFNPDFFKRDSLYYASTDEDVQSLQDEYKALKENGFKVSFLSKEEVEKRYSFSKPAALYTEGDGEVNPYKLANALVQKAHQRGVEVYTDTEIVGHQYEGEYGIFYTKDKKQIKARYVIFATGYESQSIKKDKNAVLSSSYAIVTNKIQNFEGWHQKSLIWETARPYLYFRTTADDRIMVGGLDIASTQTEERDAKLLHKAELLLKETQKLFPQYEDLKVEFSWGAIFGGTHDGLPMIGAYPEFPNSYFFLGYGGNGTVYSIILSQVLRDVIAKGGSPDLDLYLNNREKSTADSGS